MKWLGEEVVINCRCGGATGHRKGGVVRCDSCGKVQGG